VPRRPDVLGSDGLVARDSGHWAKAKLEFLDLYLPSALTALENKVAGRHYIDLFAGPGMNVGRDDGENFVGSPLRALKAASKSKTGRGFTHAVFVNKDPRHAEALQRRIDVLYQRGQAAISRANVRNLCEDANVVLPELLGSIPANDYVFVFADIQSPSHWPWSSVAALRLAHQKVDFCVLFPVDMGLKRLAPYDPQERARWVRILDSFFGSNEWARLVDELRITDAQSGRLREAFLKLYLEGLQSLWGTGSAFSIGALRRRGNHMLYELLFASRAALAHRIARSAAKGMRQYHAGGQGELLLG
jgi:three-Cys-motif partner protein